MTALTTQERSELTALFITMFLAAPGVEHLADMVHSREAGKSVLGIASDLARLPEFQRIYPDSLTSQQFAGRAVASLLTSDTPASARAWAASWIIGKLSAGESAASVLQQAAQALMLTPNPNYVAAKALMTNRIDVATHYSVTRGQSSDSLAALQDVLTGVTADPASVVAAKSVIDGTLTDGAFVLTAGVDDVQGFTGDDLIRAPSVEGGHATTTFSAFDAIDGGAGIDTLEISADATAIGGPFNPGFPTNAVVKNVEIITINNSGGAAFGVVDAARFVGATSITQAGFAAAVTNLGATTTAGFKQVAGALNVAAADSATAATIALTSVASTVTLAVKAAAEGKLDTVNITGTLAEASAATTVDSIPAAITVGKDVATLTLLSTVNLTLNVLDGAGSKDVSTIDASASTGNITYDAATTVANISTGAGKDDVTLNTHITAALTNVSLHTGKGADTLSVKVDGSADVAAKVDVAAGEGDDLISLETVALPATKALLFTIDAGAGDDIVVLKDGLSHITKDVMIDGGSGADTLEITGTPLAAKDYVLLGAVSKNFESIKFTSSLANVDASQMANVKNFAFASDVSIISNVMNDQKITAELGVKATAAGYKAATLINPAMHAGTLDLTLTPPTPTDTADWTHVYAETLKLTVKGATDNDGIAELAGGAVLKGDVTVANVTLVALTDDANTPSNTSDDVYERPWVSFETGSGVDELNALKTLTLAGNGTADINNYEGAQLTTIDASTLNSKNIAGHAAKALDFWSNNSKAETIKLGSGIDTLTLTNSTPTRTDTIQGLALMDDAALAGKQLDGSKSDLLWLYSSNGTNILNGGFEKASATPGNFNLTLANLAAASADKVVFQFGGNTYVYADVNANGGAGNGLVNDTDVLVKLTGMLDLDLLLDVLWS